MSITRNASIEQLWYTWSTTGYGSTNGFRIRKVSAGLDVNSTRVKSMDRFLRYALPTGYDSFTTNPEQAPISLSLLNTEVERVLIYKTYRGKDLVGRPGNFFAHLLAGLPATFTARDAIELWHSNFWQVADTNDQEVTMRTASGDDLVRASRTPIDLSTLHEPLTSLILAYLTHLPEPHIYLIADSSDIVAALISGLTRGLPEQLLQGLTFSTYEADVTRAPMQIVGTCLRTLSERDARAEQTILAHCRNNGLLLDCRGLGNSLPPEQETLAARFARFAAESVAYNAMEQLTDLYTHLAHIDVDRLLNEYKHVVEGAQQLSPEKIEFFLNNENYALRKLNEIGMRDAIIDFLIVDPAWWNRSLKAIMLRLQAQSSHFAYPQSRLAKRGGKMAVERMKPAISEQEMVVLETMLDLMVTLELPTPTSEVWTRLFQQVRENLQALQFLSQHWHYTSQLLTLWSEVQFQGSLDEQIKPLLWIQWPNYEHLLQLPIPLTWKAIATEQLLNDATQQPGDHNMARLSNADARQAVEEVLTFFINTPSSWATATRLFLLLTEQRFPFNRTSEERIIQFFRQMLEDRQWWNWAMLMRDALLRTYQAEYVLYLVVRSSVGRERAQEQADTLLQNSKERAAFLETRGPKLLTHPTTVSLVISLFGKLAQEYYPEKMRLLFLLLDACDDRHVEDLLKTALLSQDEKASVLTTCGKRYLTSQIVSPLLLGLFDEVMRNGYARKMDIVLTWLGAPMYDDILARVLQQARLSSAEQITVLKQYGRTYLSRPYSSRVMLDLCIDLLKTLHMLSPDKLTLVSIALSSQLDEASISGVLEAANLGIGNSITLIQDIKDLFEQHGSEFLQAMHHSFVLQRYINTYLQNFTFDDLMRQPARDLLQVLYHSTYRNTSEQIVSWYIIDTYLEQPDITGLQKFLKNVLQYKARMSVSETFLYRIAYMCHSLVSQKTDMGYLIPAVDSVFQGLNIIQLLYAMADCAAQDYDHLRQENVLLPYIYFLPQARQICGIPSQENMDYFTVALLNTLLTYAQAETVKNLDILSGDGQILAWQAYYERYKDRLTASTIEAFSSSPIGRVKGFFAYRYARYRLWSALLGRRPLKIAIVWRAHRVLLEKNGYRERIKQKSWQRIKLADDFHNAYDHNDTASIAAIYNAMRNINYFRFTKQEHRNSEAALNIMRKREELANQKAMEQARDLASSHAQEEQSMYYEHWEGYIHRSER